MELFSSHYQTSGSQDGAMQTQLKRDIEGAVNSTSAELAQLKTEVSR